MTKIFLKILLSPIALLYFSSVWLRNKLFDFGFLPTYKPNIFTICVGNLAVGGTGKSPMVEFLVEKFSKKYSTAILSRGYGRKTNGFIEANINLGANEIGDEPFQYFQKYKNNIFVFVGENRVEAAKKIYLKLPNLSLLLLDDGFQHRYICANHNIILTDYNNLLYNDLILPIGQLREPKEGLKRAQMVVITKCPNFLDLTVANNIKAKIQKISKVELPVFFTKINYGDLVQFNGEITTPTQVIIASGLANAQLFEGYCTENFNVLSLLEFNDHHEYKVKDIEKIVSKCQSKYSLIVPEKDFVKLNKLLPEHVSAFYLPICVEFLFQEENIFLSTLENALNSFYQNN